MPAKTSITYRLVYNYSIDYSLLLYPLWVAINNRQVNPDFMEAFRKTDFASLRGSKKSVTPSKWFPLKDELRGI